MYLVGSPHAHKSDAQRRLEQLVNERQRLVTDAEVLQETLHRYVAINRRDAIQPAFDAFSESWIRCWTLIGPPRSVPRRLSWATADSRRVTLSISPSWNSMESSGS